MESVFKVVGIKKQLKRKRWKGVTDIMDYSKLKYIRLFKDEYSEEKWKDICEVLGVAEKDSLTSIELGVIKATPQIHQETNKMAIVMIIQKGERMKDLIITFQNENGEKVKREYERVFDFTEEIEGEGSDAPMLDYENVTAQFFENRTENFSTIDDLYKHCMEIMK